MIMFLTISAAYSKPALSLKSLPPSLSALRIAGSSLHSHLVGCATTDPDTHHLALYVPTGADQPYTGPSEWAPVMVHIAASLLWPDLPFLVTSPDYVLGAQATLSDI